MESSKCFKIIDNQIPTKIFKYRKRSASAQSPQFSHIVKSKCHIFHKIDIFFAIGNIQASFTRR